MGEWVEMPPVSSTGKMTEWTIIWIRNLRTRTYLGKNTQQISEEHKIRTVIMLMMSLKEQNKSMIIWNTKGEFYWMFQSPAELRT